MSASQVSSSVSAVQGVSGARKLSLQLTNDIELMSKMWELKRNVYTEVHSDGRVEYKNAKIVSRVSFKKAYGQYILRERITGDWKDELVKEFSQSYYLDKTDMCEIRNKLKLIIQLLDDHEDVRNSLEGEFSRLFGLNSCRYIPLKEMKDFVQHVFSTVSTVGGSLANDLIKQILFPWTISHWIDLTSCATYCNLNMLDQIKFPPRIKREFEKKIERVSNRIFAVEIDSQKKKLREAAISRILSMIGFSEYAIPVIKHRMPIDADGMERRSVLLKPRVHALVRQNIDEHLERDFEVERENFVEKGYLIAIGILHALLHVQDGGFDKVGLTTTATGQKIYQCIDLHKSLVPVKVVDQMIPNRGLMITLQSFLWQTRYFDMKIPSKLMMLLKSDQFRTCIEEGFLTSYIDKEDQIRSEPELLKKMEVQFRERAKKMQDFAKTSRKPTLKLLFNKLYPGEMLFLTTSIKLNLITQFFLDPVQIINTSKKAFYAYEVSDLEKNLSNLLNHCRVSGTLYQHIM